MAIKQLTANIRSCEMVGMGCAGLGCDACEHRHDGMGEIVRLRGMGGLGDPLPSESSNISFPWFDSTSNTGGANQVSPANPFVNLNLPTFDTSQYASASTNSNETGVLSFFHTLGLDAASPAPQVQAVGNNNAGGSNLWGSIIAAGANTFNSIAKSKYGVPPPNTYIQTNRDGSSTIVRLPTDASGNVTGTFGGLSLGSTSSSSISTLLLLAGVGVVVMMMSRGK